MQNHPQNSPTDRHFQEPPGGKIVFSARISHNNSQIFSIHADGSHLVQLTHSKGFNQSPAWSPDGSEIAFISTCFGTWDVCIMDADGSNIRRLTKKSWIRILTPIDFHPSWSPDGQWIVFQSNRDTRKYRYGQIERFSGDIYQLYVIDREGKTIQRITNDPFHNDWKPSWSADGKKIIFHSYNMIIPSPEVEQSESRIEMIHLEDLKREVVVEDLEGSTINGYITPTWTADGNKIAFVGMSIKNFRTGEVISNLYSMQANGEEYGPIKKLSATGSNPCWSPDGKYLTFEGQINRKLSIFISKEDGSEVTPIPGIPVLSGEPNWI